MRKTKARKAWATAIAVSLVVHAIILAVVFRDWTARLPILNQRSIEITLQRSESERPVPKQIVAERPPSPVRAPSPTASAGPIAAPALRDAPAGGPPGIVAPSGTGGRGSAPKGPSDELQALAHPDLRPDCKDASVAELFGKRYADCEHVIEAAKYAANGALPLVVPENGKSYRPAVNPSWAAVAAERERQAAYRDCGNFKDCSAKYPGLISTFKRIFGD